MAAAGRRLNTSCCPVSSSYTTETFLNIVSENAVSDTIFLINEYNSLYFDQQGI
jgi:hypothetical protein